MLPPPTHFPRARRSTFPPAACHVAVGCGGGGGGTNKVVRGVAAFRRQAKEGDPAAQHSLGLSYWTGLGQDDARPNKERAVLYWTKAAKQVPLTRSSRACRVPVLRAGGHRPAPCSLAGWLLAG